MEPIGESIFRLSEGEKRVLGAEDEYIELEEIDLAAAHKRVDEAHSFLQAMQADDDQLLHHERAAVVVAFTELAMSRVLLTHIGKTLADDYPVDFSHLTPDDFSN